MDKYGKINGKTPIVNNVLAFVFSKIEVSNEKDIENVASTYYKVEELREAILYSLVDPTGQRQLPRHRTRAHIAHGIVHHMKEKIDQMRCIYLALDLNCIPYVDVADEESVKLFLEQNRVQVKLQEVLDEQAWVKSQLKEITAKLTTIHEEKNLSYAQVTSLQSNAPSTTSHSPELRPNKLRMQADGTNDKVSGPAGTNHEPLETHVPRGCTLNADGFMSRDRKASYLRNSQQERPQRQMVTGVKARARLKPAINDVRIFATRFDPEEQESDIKAYVLEQLGAECTVERINARTKRYASFIITARKKYEQALLDPNIWEEGVEVRHFYGYLRTTASVQTSDKV